MALLIGPEERALLVNLRSRAEDRPINLTAMTEETKTSEGMRKHLAHLLDQTIVVPLNYLVTFSIEVGHPGGPARHVSVSLEKKLPNKLAIWMIAEELGFAGGLEACDKIWPEKIHNRSGVAINLLQFYKTAEAAERPHH